MRPENGKTFKEQLKERGYKLTTQRQAVLDVLMEREGEHLSTERIYELVKAAIPEIGLAPSLQDTAPSLRQWILSTSLIRMTASACMNLTEKMRITGPSPYMHRLWFCGRNGRGSAGPAGGTDIKEEWLYR